MAKNSKQQDYAVAFSSAAVEKGGFKSIGDVVGLPDKEDWNNIVRIIDNFRKYSVKKYGVDILMFCIADAKREHQAAGYKTKSFSERAFGITNDDARGRHMFEFPAEFMHALTQAYPLMFTDKKHFDWFCRNFRELMIPEKH